MKKTMKAASRFLMAGALAATFGVAAPASIAFAADAPAEEAAAEETAEAPAEEAPAEEAPADEAAAEAADAEAAPLAEVTFGTFNDEAITWYVLAEEDGKALLISKDVLASMPYSDIDAGVTWSESSPRPTTDVNWVDSSLRAWLNGEFLETAFSADEQGAIQVTTLTAAKNNSPRLAADFDSVAYTLAPETEDQVFLLSSAEARKYFADNAQRVAYPTAAALEQGVYTGVTTDASGAEDPELSGASPWWLRTNGYYAGYQAVVTDDGYIHGAGYRINGEVHDGYTDHGTESSLYGGNFGVRPAIWVDAAVIA